MNTCINHSHEASTNLKITQLCWLHLIQTPQMRSSGKITLKWYYCCIDDRSTGPWDTTILMFFTYQVTNRSHWSCSQADIAQFWQCLGQRGILDISKYFPRLHIDQSYKDQQFILLENISVLYVWKTVALIKKNTYMQAVVQFFTGGRGGNIYQGWFSALFISNSSSTFIY